MSEDEEVIIIEVEDDPITLSPLFKTFPENLVCSDFVFLDLTTFKVISPVQVMVASLILLRNLPTKQIRVFKNSRRMKKSQCLGLTVEEYIMEKYMMDCPERRVLGLGSDSAARFSLMDL